MANKLIDINGLKAFLAKIKAGLAMTGSFTWGSSTDDYFMYLNKSQIVWQSPNYRIQFSSSLGISIMKREGNNFSVVMYLNKNGIQQAHETSGGAVISDAWAKDKFNNVFAGGHTNINCLAARILDIDRDNMIATVRYTVQMSNTDAQSFLVKMNGQVIAGGAGSEEQGIGAVVVTVPFTITTGAVSMSHKYSIEWI